MEFRKYFEGERIRLYSPLPAKIVAERVNAEAGSPFWPFKIGVVGRIWKGHVRLRLSSSPFEYNAKPVLAGRLVDRFGGSRFDLVYRAPAGAVVFLSAWYGFLALIAIGAVVGELNPDLTVGDILMACGVYLLLLLAPVGLHKFGTRYSADELSELIDFLTIHAEAVRQP